MKDRSPPNLQKGLETDKYKVELSEAHDQANDFNWIYLDYLEIGEIFRKKTFTKEYLQRNSSRSYTRKIAVTNSKPETIKTLKFVKSCT